MKTNYEDLEGKTVMYEYGDEEGLFEAIVAGCEYQIGITLVAKADKKHELICLNKRDIGLPREMNTLSQYRTMFHKIVKCIQDDTPFTQDVRNGIFRPNSGGNGGGLGTTCAFK